MFAYIVMGAVVYVGWEGWSLGDATYFSFITLTTIGFGDFVPGRKYVAKFCKLKCILYFVSF